jgi:hypothetical protein
VVGKRSDGHSKTQPKPLRNAAIEHAKELTQQQMADGIDKGRKKKKRKNAPHLLDQGSPDFSELGEDSASYRDQPIQIQFSAKEPSAAERRFADVIRLRLACEAEMKMFADNEEYKDLYEDAKKQWISTNSLYKKMLQERIALGNDEPSSSREEGKHPNQSYNSSVEKLAPPQKRRRLVVEEDEDSPKDSSSTSRLQDGLYCKPVPQADLEPEVLEAMRQFQAMQEDEDDNEQFV